MFNVEFLSNITYLLNSDNLKRNHFLRHSDWFDMNETICYDYLFAKIISFGVRFFGGFIKIS